MPAFYGNTEALVVAELIGVCFLLFQILFSLMQLMPVDKGNGVCNDMAVQVVFVLVDPEEGLEAAKEPVYELPPDLKTLGRRNPLVFMKADDVVRIHPARVFSPLLLLFQEAPVYTVSVYLIRTVRASDIYKSFRDLIAPEDICDDVAHCTVALCCAIDDLIDCHISSLSFLYPLICCEIFSSSLIPGAKFRLLAIRAIWLMFVAIPRSCCSREANVELISFNTAIWSDGMMAAPVIALMT